MAGPERIEWRRSLPKHDIRILGWYLALALVGLGAVWLLFGGEPQRLDSGASNPLAALPAAALVLALLGAVPPGLKIVRRPVVAANHYALTVRPGCWRTLVLPWARVTEVAAHWIGDEAYLLVRCRAGRDSLGDLPSWADRAVLRRALRDAGLQRPPAGHFDLAVWLRDFVGEPTALISTLAAFAPDHVAVVSDIHEDV